MEDELFAEQERLDREMRQALDEAKERVRPLVEKTRESEKIPTGFMEIRLR